VSDSVLPISVLMAVCEGERHLSAAVDSVFEQTHSGFELIVIDDGSTDHSCAILERYRDPRLRVVRQENQGAAAALDAGLRLARGESIAFLDQDDVWNKEKLAEHIAVLGRHPEIDLTFSWYRMIDPHGREIGLRSRRHRGTVPFASLLADFVIGATSNIVVRRAALERAGGIDRAFPRLYDLDLSLRVALLSSDNILAIPRDLMLYRRHGFQITRNPRALEPEWENLLSKFHKLAPREFAQVEKLARSNMKRYLACLEYENTRYLQGIELLREGFTIAPFRFLIDSRNWLAAAACLSGALLPSPWHSQLERIAGLRRDGS
jgi:glycosyltransferase involved in cell wall biosynthesis